MPDVFEGLKDTLLAFFSTLTDMLAFSTEALKEGQTAMVYPHVPQIH